jgi:multidrug efflux system membrane fusion protein
MKLLKPSVLLAILATLGIASIVATNYGLFGQNSKTHDKAEKGVPVKIAVADRKNTPVYLSSIATVQALNTVLVRARVDGQIDRVLFSEGANVKRGQVLVELDRRPFEVQLRAAMAQKAKDDAQLANAKRDLARYEILAAQDSIATQTLDTTRANYEQLRAAVDADQAQIEFAQLQLNYATIKAPIDGRIGARLVDAGNTVHPNDANGIAVVSQLQPVSVSFSLPQTMLPALQGQQKRQARHVQALSADGSIVIDEGTLTLIESQIDTATGTIRCKATFENSREALWPGAFVSVRVLMDDLPNTVTVPTSAIQPSTQRPFVFIVGPDNVAEVRQVEPGPASGSRTVILAGLSGGEQVVVEGQFQLEAGKRVDLSPAVKPSADDSKAAKP